MAAKVIRKHLTLVSTDADGVIEWNIAPPTADPTQALNDALAKGREATTILTAEPADEEHGYSLDEVAQQMAASDRLVAAFATIDRLLGDPAAAFTL